MSLNDHPCLTKVFLEIKWERERILYILSSLQSSVFSLNCKAENFLHGYIFPKSGERRHKILLPFPPRSFALGERSFQ